MSVFLPLMLASGEPGHVVNTSSPDGGIVAVANAGVYAASKAAVVTLTECLHAQLEEMDAPVGASVLLPTGLLRTGLWTAAAPTSTRPPCSDAPDQDPGLTP